MKRRQTQQLVPRTRACNTMTEAEFFGMLRSMLRRKTMMWPPIKQALELAKRVSQSRNTRLKWEYQCAGCRKWFPKKEVSVDHIIEAGSLSRYEDLHPFIHRLFCELEGLQVLCCKCHDRKTHKR